MSDAHPNAPGNGNDPQEFTEHETRVIEGPSPRLIATSTLAADLAAAEIDQQIATARRYPRILGNVVRAIREMACIDEATADNCVYALPRAQKPIVGASIGFANVVAQAWGNCRDGSRITFINREDKVVIAEGAFHDLETNRLSIVPVSRRISDRNGRLYNDDMITVTGMAAAAIARRNAILNGVPRTVWHPSYEAALRIVRGTRETLAERREKAVKAMAKFGVEPKTIFKFLGVPSMQEIDIEHMPLLRAIYNQLREEVITPEELFDPRKMGSVGFERVENPLGDEPRKAQEAPRDQTAAPAKETGKPAARKPRTKRDKEGEPAPSTDRAESQHIESEGGAGTTVGSTPKPEETPPKAEAADPHAGLLHGMPRTPEEYEARAIRFIDGAQSAQWLRDTWNAKPERNLRGECRIVEEIFESLKERCDKRIRELESSGK